MPARAALLVGMIAVATAPMPWDKAPAPAKPMQTAEAWTTNVRGTSKALAADVISQALADNTVVIFSRSACSGCQKVKEYFEDAGIPYYAMELDTRADGEALRGALAEKNGNEKVPAVYIRGQLVGGYDIGRAYKSGELAHWATTET